MATSIDWTDFLIKIADYTGVESKSIHENTNIYTDLGLDSLGLFSMGMFLIKTYGVKIPMSAVASFETVNDIYVMMNEQIKANTIL